MSKNPIVEGLWNGDGPPVGPGQEQYWNLVMEQYKIYVEMADRVSARRVQVNTFFLTVNTVLITAAGLEYDAGVTATPSWFLLFPLAALMAMSFTWWRIIKSFRQLNSAKFRVIGEFEGRLPASPYWAAEWKALGEGKNPDLYKPLTHVEHWVPIIFGSMYCFGFLVVLWIVLCSQCR